MLDTMAAVHRWDHPLYLAWLNSLPGEAAAAVVSAVDYLTEFGHNAQLDLARHRIQTSKRFPDMTKARIRDQTQAHDLILRVLTIFTNNDQTLVVCFAGDKAKWFGAVPAHHGASCPVPTDFGHSGCRLMLTLAVRVTLPSGRVQRTSMM